MKGFKSIMFASIILITSVNISLGQDEKELKIYHSIEEGLEEPDKVKYLEIRNSSNNDSLKLLSQFPKLQSLSLIDFHSAMAPEAISELKNLKELRFINDDFYTIPTSYSQLSSLTKLEFIYDTHLDLNNTFNVINKISSLKELKIEGLPDSKFSDDLIFPSQLRVLSLRNNYLDHIPTGILGISSLETLDVGDNEFFELPMELSNLSNLNTIYLDRLPFLQIDQIFPVLNRAPMLQFVHLEGNHLDNNSIKDFKYQSLFQIFLDQDLPQNNLMNQEKVNLIIPKTKAHSDDPKEASFKIPLKRN